MTHTTVSLCVIMVIGQLIQDCKCFNHPFKNTFFSNNMPHIYPQPKRQPGCGIICVVSLKKKLHPFQRCTAHLGSTDLWEPLRSSHILSPAPGTIQNLFLISDGHVTQESLVVKATRLAAANNRVFTMGVG